MNKFSSATAGLVIALVFSVATVSAGQSQEINSATLQSLKFSAPQGEKELAYLGIRAGSTFGLADIKAAAIVCEIFSMYCPRCQADAPRVNELFQSIQKNANLKEKVKLLGIGIGNTPFEVDVFRKKYGVEFPLVPDEGFALQKAASQQIRTPTFVALIPGKDGLKVVHVQVGEMGDPEPFVKKLSSWLAR